MHYVGRVIRAFFYGSTLHLRAYERAILDRAEPVLEPDAWRRLQDQVIAIQTCQRTLQDRMVQTFLDRAAAPIGSDQAELVELLRGRITVSGQTSPAVGFRVFLWNGRLSTIEFSKSPRILKAQPVDIVYKDRPSTKADLGAVADRFEHGA